MNHGAPSADFFISYTSADKQWAEWIGFVLEEQGFSVVIQAWDFRPGSNFVIEMQRAAEGASRTIMVLSPDYLQSQFAAPEWAAAFAKDPQGIDRKLVPVVVRTCHPDGMLKPLVHIDLTGRGEAEARTALIEGVGTSRAKPSARPTFPGGGPEAPETGFPGESRRIDPARRSSPYIPALKGPASDLDKRRFGREAFSAVASYFEAALPMLAGAGQTVEADFQRNGDSEFSAEIFRSGKSLAFCRIWRGSMHSTDGIGYSEDRNANGRDSYNEMLTISDAQGALCLSALMSDFSFGRSPEGLDPKSLSADDAAEYLWRRFVSRLDR